MQTDPRSEAPVEGGGRTATLAATVRTLYLERRTGALEMQHSGESRRLYFVKGELHLAENHPLARQVTRYLEITRDGVSAVSMATGEGDGEGPNLPSKARRELRKLLGRIAGFLTQLEVEDFRFLEGIDSLAVALVGPLPTADLVMELAVQGCSEGELLLRLGGGRARWCMRPEAQKLAEALWIDTDEAFLLSRLESPMTVDDLIRQIGRERDVVLRELARLQAVDLILPAEAAGKAVRRPTSLRESRLSAAVLQRFRERMTADLKERPVSLEEDNHREYLADLFTRLGEANHYELLEVATGATVEEVYDGYHRLARLVHPVHAPRLGLQGKEEALELLFERATEAYVTLSDPNRRSRYDQEHAIDPLAGSLPEDTLQLQAQDLAWEYFRRARKLFSDEKYHDALELLLEAVRLDPQADYYGLLAKVQAKNPNWLTDAVDSYREALDLDPSNVEVRVGLATICEELGRLSEARLNFEDVLERSPKHPEATAGLERLDVREGKKRPKRQGGFFAWLSNLLR